MIMSKPVYVANTNEIDKIITKKMGPGEIRGSRSTIDEKRKSTITFETDSILTDRQLRERISRLTNDDNMYFTESPQDKSIKRVSSSLTTIEKISRIKLARKDKDETNSVNKEDDDLIMQRQRGSTTRSTLLLDPTTSGKFSVGTLDASRRSFSLQVRSSDNVPVRNMSIDQPPSDDLPIEEADAYANIIDDLLNQLELIKYTIPVKVSDNWDESYKTMEEKYGDENYDELQLILNEHVSPALSRSSTMKKLQRDRTYIYNVLKDLVTDLRSRRRYDGFEKEIDNIVKTSEEQHNLKINHEIWSQQLAQLKELIFNEKIDNDTQVEKLLASVQESGARIESAIFLCGSKLGYIEKWEKARLDQQKLILEVKEQMLQDELSECMNVEKTDDIISEDLRNFLHADVAKMEADIEILSSRYNEDIDQCQRDIDYFNERIKDVKEALEQKYKLRDKRQMVIDEYEKAEREKAKEAEYWTGIHRNATIIQSVWRGYMVRHQLGKFKRLWVKLKRRKKLAAKRRKKRKARAKKIAALKADAKKKKLK